jgi:hypothetical protein
MAKAPTLEELLADASAAKAARLVERSRIRLGGVDPLGLRQINFGLMDEVLPDLNNVARHIRPYILMAWAWRRVRRIIEAGARSGATDEQMRDFVDRIEAIYAWSQFLVTQNADLPGKLALRPLIEKARYRFGGEAWEELRDMRRYSTGLISPLNYGPSLRTLGWLIPVDGATGVFQPPDALDPALDAFESGFAEELDHEAFSRFGPVTVAREDVERWGGLWSLGAPRRKEKTAAYTRLGGDLADARRQRGVALIRAAWRDLGDEEASVADVRARMADVADDWESETPPAAAADWRAMQVRQAFRLALESLFFWTIATLRQNGTMRSAALAQTFLDAIEDPLPTTAGAWMLDGVNDDNPAEHVNALYEGLRRPSELPAAIVAAIRHALREPATTRDFERRDRLPLARAKEEAEQWAGLTPHAFLVRLIEVWVIAQHTYWCVARGLADARSGGKTILRMRIVMEEGGWTLTPETSGANPPEATPDRLDTAVSLLWECDRLN